MKSKFLQSGFARVVVPLREGMEAAVFNFLKTGQVWNNKDMPSIGDQLYLDIIQEVKEATDYPENPKCIETWTYKIPTNLVILQSDDSPIEDEGLPCFAEEGCPG